MKTSFQSILFDKHLDFVEVLQCLKILAMLMTGNIVRLFLERSFTSSS